MANAKNIQVNQDRLWESLMEMAKIGATDGKSFQQMAGSMTGMSEEAYRDMMIAGGRDPKWGRETK